MYTKALTMFKAFDTIQVCCYGDYMPIARENLFASQILELVEKSDFESIVELCKSEVEYLKNQLKLSSLKSNFSIYRNTLKSLNIPNVEDYLKIFRLSKEEYKSLDLHFKKQVYGDNTNLRPIHNYDQIILKSESLLNSNAYTAVACGLCMLTGRRLSEILKTAKFDLDSDNTMIFSGQLKTKNSENARLNPYQIPVLSDPTLIIAGLNNLRNLKDFSNLTTKQVHSRSNKSCNEAVKRYYGELINNVCVKDLRSIYATIAYAIFSPPTISVTAYHAKILGHSELDLSAAQSYMDFYLVED